MKRFIKNFSFGFLLRTMYVLVTLSTSDCTSLMKRIREKQTADDAMRKEMDFQTDWVHVPQPIQDALMSIDDKLRSLDTFSYTLKLARLDFSLDQLVRRMENIETKLGRLETKFDVRMEKIEEVVISKDIKEEFSNEHISRGMENLHDKINNKAAYLDAKLDIKLERIMNKLDLLERDLHSSVDDILERLIKNDERHGNFENEIIKKGVTFEKCVNDVNELRLYMKEEFSGLLKEKSEDVNTHFSQLQDSLNSASIKTETAVARLQNTMHNTTNKVKSIIDRNSNKIESLSENCSYLNRMRTLTDNCETMQGTTVQQKLDNLTIILQKALNIGEEKFKELDSDVELYTRKVINGIQELWKTSDELKLDLSHTLEQGNKTREMVRQEFRRLHEQIEPLPKLEPRLSNISEDIDRKVVELSATVDNSFATLLIAQNEFITSCRRIQENEMHIYEILQQMVYEMRNRSINDIDKIKFELQTQSSQIQKSLADVTHAIFIAKDNTTDVLTNLHHQMKEQSKCIIQTENIDWKVVESLCHQVSVKLPSPETIFMTNLARTSDDDATNNLNFENDSRDEQTLSKLKNNSNKLSQETDNITPLSLSEYEPEYLSDMDYSETINT